MGLKAIFLNVLITHQNPSPGPSQHENISHGNVAVASTTHAIGTAFSAKMRRAIRIQCGCHWQVREVAPDFPLEEILVESEWVPGDYKEEAEEVPTSKTIR